VLVDEGTSEEAVFRINIKGNALTEDRQFFHFADMTLLCYDVTTGE